MDGRERLPQEEWEEIAKRMGVNFETLESLGIEEAYYKGFFCKYCSDYRDCLSPQAKEIRSKMSGGQNITDKKDSLEIFTEFLGRIVKSAIKSLDSIGDEGLETETEEEEEL